MASESFIAYANELDLSAQEFCDVLNASTLSERRPVNDLPRLDKMLRMANIVMTARDGKKLVGIARALTDFAYCCYLSDLAVDVAYQKQGIGKRLIEETHKSASSQTTLILTSAPAAVNYYPKIGMSTLPCFAFLRSG
ncbi:MAG: GNAT family N-acetyltransferase [Bdellovibrionales bacterium]